MKFIPLILAIFLAGCGTSVKDVTLIPTGSVNIPDNVRIPCRAAEPPSNALSEVDTLIYISSLYDTIDDCDNKRFIAVDIIDGLNMKPETLPNLGVQ